MPRPQIKSLFKIVATKYEHGARKFRWHTNFKIKPSGEIVDNYSTDERIEAYEFTDFPEKALLELKRLKPDWDIYYTEEILYYAAYAVKPEKDKDGPDTIYGEQRKMWKKLTKCDKF